ncbi:MAG: DUF3822 family protein [Bacteroidaceae bacterium]|jgi:hypothetical protein
MAPLSTATSAPSLSLALHLTPEAFYGTVVPDGELTAPTGGKPQASAFRMPTDECTSLAANVKTLLAQHPEWEQKRYGQVDIIVETLRYTPVPLELFEEDRKKELFGCCFEPKEEEQIRHDILAFCNAVVVFSADRFALNMLLDPFPQAKIHSQAAIDAEYFGRLYREKEPMELCAVFNAERIHAYAYRQGGLLSLSSFTSLSADDAVYYLLSLMKQHEMDLRSHTLHLAGQSEYLDAADQMARRFVRFVDRIPLPATEDNTFSLYALQQLQNS